MTILHILDHSAPIMSGYASRSGSIVRFQREIGLRPVVLTSPKHGSTSTVTEILDGIPHHRTAAGGSRTPYVEEIGLMLRLARRVAEVARQEGARILHAHSPVLNGLPALWAARRLRLPLVYEARAFWEDAAVDHGTTREGAFRYRVSRLLETLIFRGADRVVTIGDAMRREVIARGIAPLRVEVVPNGVDTKWLRPAERDPELVRRLGLAGGPILGFIGSFYRYEGLRFLVEALPAIRRQVPGARLLLVGGGEEDAVLRALARPLGDAVVFAGVVPFREVREYYTCLDVFVCPRRRMRLTELVTPLKPLEAMAMGLPVLASDVGGLTELVTHGRTGLLFRAESAEAFVSEAIRLAADLELRRRLGAAAREHIERERGWPRVVSRYLRIYRDLGRAGGADQRTAEVSAPRTGSLHGRR
jgi:glycogen(starch) synthase